jgi:RNA polymerase sigma-70 factor (ECF subfamily)
VEELRLTLSKSDERRLRQEAFVGLLDQHMGIAHKVALGYTRTPEDRQDLVQEIAAQLWRAFPRYDPQRPFSTWMYRIALNVAISRLRRETRHQVVPADPSDLDTIASPKAEPSDVVADLWRQIERLDPLNRALLLLYLDDRSYAEIAEVLGITETNVATKLSRLKRRLRDDLVDQEKES